MSEVTLITLPTTQADGTLRRVERSLRMVLVLMGVSGSGKTTIGRLLARQLTWSFVDADEFHSAQNIAQMCAGTGLTDEQRSVWIDALVHQLRERGERNTVLACSALTRRIRRRLRAELPGEVQFVWLKADEQQLNERLGARSGHYAGASLLPSQLKALEPPQHALIIDAQLAPGVICGMILRWLRSDEH